MIQLVVAVGARFRRVRCPIQARPMRKRSLTREALAVWLVAVGGGRQAAEIVCNPDSEKTTPLGNSLTGQAIPYRKRQVIRARITTDEGMGDNHAFGSSPIWLESIGQ